MKSRDCADASLFPLSSDVSVLLCPDRTEELTDRTSRKYAPERQHQAAVRGGPASPGLQQEPVGKVHRFVLRKRSHRLRHPHL